MNATIPRTTKQMACLTACTQLQLQLLPAVVSSAAACS